MKHRAKAAPGRVGARRVGAINLGRIRMGPFRRGSRRLTALLAAGFLIAGAVVAVGPLGGAGSAAAQASGCDSPAATWASLRSQVAAGGTVCLANNISSLDGQQLDIAQPGTTLDLMGFTLSITGTDDALAAVHVPTTVDFTVQDSSAGESGVLIAEGGRLGAGIGGGGTERQPFAPSGPGAPGNPGFPGGSSGTVTILSGTVTATGGDYGAGIGGGGSVSIGSPGNWGEAERPQGGVGGQGGRGGAGGTVVIQGGTVTAHGGIGAAGIGGGSTTGAGGTGGAGWGQAGATGGSGGEGGPGASVTVGAGTVRAVGGAGGPGIGGGGSAANGGSGGPGGHQDMGYQAQCFDGGDGGSAGSASAVPGSLKVSGGIVTGKGGAGAAGVGGGIATGTGGAGGAHGTSQSFSCGNSPNAGSPGVAGNGGVGASVTMTGGLLLGESGAGDSASIGSGVPATGAAAAGTMLIDGGCSTLDCDFAPATSVAPVHGLVPEIERVSSGIPHSEYTQTNTPSPAGGVAKTRVAYTPAFSSPSSLDAVVGEAVMFSVATANSLSPVLTAADLPAWLSFTDHGDGTGVLTGTPPASALTDTGTITLDARVDGPGAPITASQTLSWSVNEMPSFSGDASVNAVDGEPFSYDPTLGGWPAPAVTVTNGPLPDGLLLNPSNGVISGTVTAGVTGVFPITLTATNVVGSATLGVTINVEEAPVLAGDTSPTAVAGEQFTWTPTTLTGAPAPNVAVVEGEMPDWLSLDPDTGELTGTPSTEDGGVTGFTLAAHNGLDPSVSLPITLTVDVAPTISGDAIVAGQVGVPFTWTPSLTGYPEPSVAVTAGDLPDGLVLDSETGEISGTPGLGADGTFDLTLTATNDDTSAELEVTLTIARAQATIMLSRVTVQPGDEIRVRGAGLDPAEPYELWLHSTPIQIGSGEASATGVVDAMIRLPAHTTPGDHRIELRRPTGGDSAWADVRVVAAPVPPGSSLSATGGEHHGLMYLGGLALLSIGGILWRWRRSAHRNTRGETFDLP